MRRLHTNEVPNMIKVMPFSSHKKLSRSIYFWVAMSIPVLLATLVAATIFHSSPGVGFCFSADCWTNFFQLYKIPITIAGTSIPAAAIVATLHRSHETAIQISMSFQQYQEAVSNNRFGNFLKHREGFIKHMEGVVVGLEHKGVKCNVDSGALYHAVFPKNGFEDFEWASDINQTIWVDSQALLSKLSEIFSQRNEPPAGEAVLAGVKILNDLQRTFSFRHSDPVRYQLSVKERIYHLYNFPKLAEGIDHDRCVAIAVVSFLEFIRKTASFCFVDLDISKFEKSLNLPNIVEFIAESEIEIEDYEE